MGRLRLTTRRVPDREDTHLSVQFAGGVVGEGMEETALRSLPGQLLCECAGLAEEFVQF